MGRAKSIDVFGARSKASSRPAPSPKVRPTVDERAEKAERIAHAQHSTSLLKDPAPRRGGRGIAVTARGGGSGEKRGMPFALQLLIVMVLAGVAAFSISIYAPDLMYSVL